VVGYDRLIEVQGAFYLTFDNIEVGRMQAREVLRVQPRGNYVFIKGRPPIRTPTSSTRGGNAKCCARRCRAARSASSASSTPTAGAGVAQRNMEQILTANNNRVDAVVASNDGTAGGAIAALTAQGLQGRVPVSGQDGDQAALNRIALGTQTVSVWKDAATGDEGGGDRGRPGTRHAAPRCRACSAGARPAASSSTRCSCGRWRSRART
jgi:D-xylose transport system substrate-binding protein